MCLVKTFKFEECIQTISKLLKNEDNFETLSASVKKLRNTVKKILKTIFFLTQRLLSLKMYTEPELIVSM